VCRGKRTCSELGNDASAWPKSAPLLPPLWFEEQLLIFQEAVRHAANGNVESARAHIRSTRKEDLQTWFIEHGQQSGIFRSRHYGRAKPAVVDALDPVSSPERLAKDVLVRDGYQCRYCGLRLVSKNVLAAFSKVVGPDIFRPTGRNLERHGIVLAFRANADHVFPWKLGGRTELENLVCACWCCNYGKSAYTIDQIGVDDPRSRPIPTANGWDGLTSFLPALQSVQREK